MLDTLSVDCLELVLSNLSPGEIFKARAVHSAVYGAALSRHVWDALIELHALTEQAGAFAEWHPARAFFAARYAASD